MEERIKYMFENDKSDDRSAAEILRHGDHRDSGFGREGGPAYDADDQDDFDLEDLWDNVPV